MRDANKAQYFHALYLHMHKIDFNFVDWIGLTVWHRCFPFFKDCSRAQTLSIGHLKKLRRMSQVKHINEAIKRPLGKLRIVYSLGFDLYVTRREKVVESLVKEGS